MSIILVTHSSGWKAAILTRSCTQFGAGNEAVAERKCKNKTGEYSHTFPECIHELYAIHEVPEKRKEAKFYGKDSGLCEGQVGPMNLLKNIYPL